MTRTRFLCVALCCALLFCLFAGCNSGKTYDPLEGVETTEFTDSAGRTVTIPKNITRIAASGSTSR